jgi:glycosyl-4,4'-diaponeurosporenoate acyltransferase
MRVLVLSTSATVVIDIGAWFLLHMGISKWLTSWEGKRFNPRSWLYRERAWEKGGMLYRRVFGVRMWKKRLPDAAAWFTGGFAKKNLSSLSEVYLRRFMIETCRGELAHWITMGVAPVFFLWNDSWVGILMLVYAAAANLPCIITQRYNRIRLSRLGM